MPHFHAVYGEYKITVEIESDTVRGEFPPRALRLVLEWAELHKQELFGPVFEPLRDTAVFRRFQIHPEFHTLTWPNGADFAPEFLHDNVRVTA